ncbi:TPA: hypothetical protein I9080_003173 [Clostridium perfringens]|uniref:Uncharacterized protein n=1 Tax=Clostridium perfringens TaxID=1502 RepID=A0A8H9UY52_CLOPF|nr:hypothetical protein [Clostridium perfringens]HAT4315339.1 hypothetical protein [Clostridium perfringens]
MKIKYIEKINLTIYKIKENIYGVSDYLDINFDKNLNAINGTSCRHGYFQTLTNQELSEITRIVTNQN